MSRVLVIDNGAWECKWGWSDTSEPRSVPNCSVKTKASKTQLKRRLLIGEETRAVRESGTVFRRPFERGFVVDWGQEQRIWDSEQMPIRDSSVLVTVAPCQPARLNADLAEVLYEEMGAAALFCMASPTAAGWLEGRGDSLVVDAGYSHCHVQLVVDGRSGLVGRLDLGGKALTNYLKELVSYRQWNMMDETWLVNRVKERLAMVVPSLEDTLGPKGDRSFTRSFVLPDFVSSTTGWILEEDQPPPDAPAERQLLVLGPERVALGEALFRPSDLGLSQGGLGEGALGLLAKASETARVSCPGRVIFAGGTAEMPGFCDRFMSELRAGLPDDVSSRRAAVRVAPRLSAWYGAARFSRLPDYSPVLRSDYMERGAAVCAQRFAPYL